MIKIKSKIRNDILEKRNLILQTELISKSKIIQNIILNSSSYKKCNTVFTYVSVGSEVSTLELINHAFNDGKKVAVPIAKKGGVMFFTEIKSLNSLVKTKFGVLEPVASEESEIIPNKDDLFIIPGSVFDKRLNRYGYGGGYYDRYLEKNKEIKKIAVAFDFQILDEISTDYYDKKMDIVISEKKILGEELK